MTFRTVFRVGWRARVAPGHITLEELAALLCWQPARLLGLPAKGRLHPGCDADLAVLDPEAPATGDEAVEVQPEAEEDAAARPGRWIGATAVREPL